MSNQDNKELQIVLTFEEVNLVLKALGNLPFKDVFDIIGKIHDQANEQMQADKS